MHFGRHPLIGCTITSIVVVTVLAAGIAWAARTMLAQNEAPPGYTGSPERGRRLVTSYGCSSCHEIPGVEPRGMVGPSLDHMATRSYVAGRIPNERIEMEQWLQHPQALRPGTAMPDLGVTSADARDIAAYLATLK